MEHRLLQTVFTASPASFPNQDISDAFPHLHLDNATGFQSNNLRGPVYSAVSSTQQGVSVFSPTSGAGGQTAQQWQNPTSSMRATFDTGASDVSLVIRGQSGARAEVVYFDSAQNRIGDHSITIPTSGTWSESFHRNSSDITYVFATGTFGSSVEFNSLSYTIGTTSSDDHGNTPSTATLIAVPSTTAGNLEVAGDNDFFKFNAISGNRYTFTVSLGSLSDSTLRILDTDGLTQLDFNDDANGGLGSQIEFTAATSGVYYLEVRGFIDGFSGTYSLNASTLPPAVPTLAIAATNASRAEENSGSTPFTFTVTRSGDTSGATSVSYFVSGSGTNSASTSDFIGGAFPNGTVSFTAGETSKAVTINVNGDTTGESNEGFTVTLSNPTGGAIISTASATGTIQNDDAADDHGNTPSTATLIAVPSTTAGNLEVAGDNDFFKFNAISGNRYTFTVSLGSLSDSTLRILDTDGLTQLDFNDDANGGLGSQIEFTATTSRVYYLEVRGFFDGFSGTYSLNASTLPPAVPTLAIAATNASRAEENSGSTPFTFTVTRSGDTSGATSVSYFVSGSGTNSASASDFVAGTLPSGTVNFAAGETSKAVTINVNGDTTGESNGVCPEILAVLSFCGVAS